jgi:hypothetical protein
MLAAGDLAIAVVPHLVERKKPRLLDSAAHAECTVHCRPDLVIVLEAKTDAVDRRDRHDGRQDHPGEVEELDHAGAQLRQHVGSPAKLAAGKNLDFHPTAGLLANTFHCLLKVDVH